MAGLGGPDQVAALFDRDDGGCPGSTDVPRPDAIDDARAATLCLLNQERAEHGLLPLEVSLRLERASQKHSEDMGERNFYAHDDPDGRGFESRVEAEGVPMLGMAVAENIHWGLDVAARPKQIVEDWMNSPGHRANILNVTLTQVGIGIGFDPPSRVREPAAVYTTDFSGRLREAR
jgi:uncharacterized protein YkwD